jgi:serralysin
VLATPLGSLAIGGAKVLGAGGNGTAIGESETDFISIANENDDDVFSFTVASPLSLDLSMTPRGASYSQGATVFNTFATTNLTLQLLASDGVTVLADASAGVAGSAESITDFAITQPGTYYARVRTALETAGQVVQFYRLDLAATALPPALLGDFNANGLVDAADYTVWRSENGLARPAFTGADHTGDGLVNAADYGLWASNYGASGAVSAAAVPEPGAVALAGTLFLAGAIGRRR